MNDLPVDGFQNAIRAVHGAGSRLISRERVEETFEGDPVWTGEVLTFELLDHPQATRCYCWEVDGKFRSRTRTRRRSRRCVKRIDRAKAYISLNSM